MSNQAMNKDKWIELFQAIGLSDDQMKKWHHEFEANYPNEHQQFLKWLQIPNEDIALIRSL
jgi:hypothetical protein